MNIPSTYCADALDLFIQFLNTPNTTRLSGFRIQIHGIYIDKLESELDSGIAIRMLEKYLHYNYTF